MENITYQELARRVGDCVLNNNIRNSEEYGDGFELINGEVSYCAKHETIDECEADDESCCETEYIEIYQDYIITESGAGYLQRNTNEIVFYNEHLDMYIWGITHFGTSWNGVYTAVKK